MPAKGSKFILEHLKERIKSSTTEELNLAYKAMDFVGVFLNQLDNWLLNFLDVQMFGAGDKFFLRLATKGRLRIDIEVSRLGSDPSYAAVSLVTNQGLFDFQLLGLEDLAGARCIGQQAMEIIGERKKFSK